MIEASEIGFLKKTYGRHGHIKIDLQSKDYFEILHPDSFLFIRIDGYLVPFQIEEIVQEITPLIKFVQFNSPEKSRKFVNNPIFLETKNIPLNILEQSDKPSNHFSEYHDYTVKLPDGAIVGKILEIKDLGLHYTATLKSIERVFEIPMNEKLIIEVDEINHSIVMDLPEGL